MNYGNNRDTEIEVLLGKVDIVHKQVVKGCVCVCVSATTECALYSSQYSRVHSRNVHTETMKTKITHATYTVPVKGLDTAHRSHSSACPLHSGCVERDNEAPLMKYGLEVDFKI